MTSPTIRILRDRHWCSVRWQAFSVSMVAMSASSQSGVVPATLYIVATPLGNLGDITSRAQAVLASVNAVLAEDTRHSEKLLSALGIRNRLQSFHDHSTSDHVEKLIERLKGGDSMALISDAGTPLISDPGYELVARCREDGISVLPVPGAAAVTTALSVSGLPSDRFLFAGFLSAKAARRRTQIAELAPSTATIILYESCHRIAATLDDLVAELGEDRPAFVGREMTKLYEQYCTGTIGALAEQTRQGQIAARGEFVIIIGPAATANADQEQQEAMRLLKVLITELPVSQAAKIAAKLSGVPRRKCFALAEQIKNS